MGSRLVALCLIAALSISQPGASAATKKPTAKPSAKATAKATAKPSVKATAKPTSKPTAKKTSQPTSKATSKTTTKSTATPTAKASATATPKKVVKKKAVKRKPRKKVRISPSPKPVWPPKGFSAEGEVFAKVPSAKELVGIISANKSLATQVKDCEKFICGAVQVASETGCIWWEVISTVLTSDGKKLGELTTAHGSSKVREIKTLLTISPESNANGGSAKIESVLCHHEDRDSSRASVTYQKN